MKTILSRAVAAIASVITTFALLHGVAFLAEPTADASPALIANAAPVTTSR
jgi:hypothetical protein